MSNLFRPEALAGLEQREFGEARLDRPLPLALLAALLGLCVVGTGMFIGFGEYTRKAHVSGVLVPDRGVIRLYAPKAGRVVARSAQEGATVHAGDVLFVLSMDRETQAGGAELVIQREIDRRKSSVEESLHVETLLRGQQREALEVRGGQLRRELADLDAQIRLHKNRLSLAELGEARARSLQDSNFVSPAQVQSRTDEVLALQAQELSLERQRSALVREESQLSSQLRELPLQGRARRAELERSVAELEQARLESEASREVLVRAPVSGTLSTLVAEVGQSVVPEVSLATILPEDAKLQAQLYAPSSAVGLLRPDLPVRMRVAAFPFERFGHQLGRIERISAVPLPDAEMIGLDSGSRTGEPLYRITVELDDQQVRSAKVSMPLTAGMRIDADVMLERRTLFHWLFDPLAGAIRRSG